MPDPLRAKLVSESASGMASASTSPPEATRNCVRFACVIYYGMLRWTKRLRRGMGGAGWVGCADWGVIPWDFRPLWLEFFGPQPRKGITMSELSNRMIRDMQLAGLVEGTRREYLRGVRQLAAYYMVSPDQLSERNVEDYILYVRDDLGVAKGTFAPMFAGLKFFYLNTLGSDWPLFTKKKSASHAGSGCPTSAVTRTAAT